MPLPPDRVRPGFVVYEVLSGREPLRVWTRDFEGRRTPGPAQHVTAATITDLHQEFKIRIGEINAERAAAVGDGRRHGRRLPPLRGMTYESFHRYIQKALRIDLLMIAGSEPAGPIRGHSHVLAPRVLVALGTRGEQRSLWENVSKAYAVRAETEPTTITRPETARRKRKMER